MSDDTTGIQEHDYRNPEGVAASFPAVSLRSTAG
jgi:hypothetical protein